MTKSHSLVALARRAIELHVGEARRLDLPPLQELDPEMHRQAGAFVTIRRQGKLRGCIGTIQPVCENVAEEVIQNAVSAATRDPRFPPLHRDELEDLEVKVDVLGEPELVDNLDQLDPKRYGLIIQSLKNAWKRGLLLPDLEGIDTVEKQVHWTRHYKAGITDPDEPVQMFRFEVKRYS
jgi:AmmeMemoRadiSam system protein A